MITEQASMIAYLNDYRLMLWLTLGVIPLLFLLRPSRRPPAAGEAAHAVMD
jgi:DHA2 family multidrug resistance protein